MVNIRAGFVKRDVQRIQKVAKAVAKVTRKTSQDVLKQSMFFAIKSAAVATKPGNKSNVNAVKYRYRPLVKGNARKMLRSMTGYYYYINDKDKMFRTKNDISRKTMKAKGMTPVTKAIKAWDKKKKKFTYRPTRHKKRDKTKKIFQIPFAGGAKAGWRTAAKFIPGKRPKFPNDKSAKNREPAKINDVTVRPWSIRVDNLVKYVSKSAPMSGIIGLKKAANRMEAIYIKKAESKIAKEWNKL